MFDDESDDAVTAEDGAALLGLETTEEADPRLVAFLGDLVRADGEAPEDLVPPATGDEIVRALAALVPDARERQRRASIPEATTLATLRDVGRKHRLYGAATVLPWLLGILRGDVLEVGRLQVERRAGAHGHALHVPESGALSPSLVDDALSRAAAVTGARAFSCTSWLLDPRIGSALPASNIAKFAARFRLVDSGEATAVASAEAAKFVFRRSPADVLDPALVTPNTSLEQLVASTLRGGDDWAAPVGVLVLT